MGIFRVEHLRDNTYQVVYKEVECPVETCQDDVDEGPVVYHQGSLADCEAYIRLKEGGYM